MGSFEERLEYLYKQALSMECPPISKMSFTGNYIFEFTTYDDEVDEGFAIGLFKVLDAIINKTTFDFIKDEINYIGYLTHVNSRFLYEKLEWGSSIRGAWLDEFKQYEIYGGNIIIAEGKLEIFIRELMEWVDS